MKITRWTDRAVLYEADAASMREYLAGAYLAGAYLDGANLDGANLAGAYLAGANLARAYLAGANLAGANLAGANLAGANLAGAYLAGAYLDGAYLAGANLGGVKAGKPDHSEGTIKGIPTAGHLLSYRYYFVQYQDGCTALRYGCEYRTLADWRENLTALCQKHEASRASEYERALSALITLCEALDKEQDNGA